MRKTGYEAAHRVSPERPKNGGYGIGSGAGGSHRLGLTSGQKAADILTGAVGSWIFLGILSVFLVFWIGINSVAMFRRWDPYPFILLNLILSFVAAYQAPIILMSQGRTEDRDRAKSERDHAVNRKAEREVRDMQADLEEIKAMIRRLDRKVSEVRRTDGVGAEAAKDRRRKIVGTRLG